MRVKELAVWLEAPWEGEGDREIRRVATLEDAGDEDLSFVTHGRAAKLATASRAACLLVPDDFVNEPRRTVIRTRDPRAAVARAIPKLHPHPEPSPGVHPTAVLGPGVGDRQRRVHRTPGEPGRRRAHWRRHLHRSRIGHRGLCPHRAALRVAPARDGLYHDVTLGNHVILHSGCVIGADGFGFILTDGAYEKFPQVGRVMIADHVEIGANSCVDRAALGVTSIGEGAKLDNLVHIAHNCRIGRHVVIAAQTGLSGGVVVEDYAVIGGQVGIGDKARIESRAVLGSGSGVLTSKIVRAGQVMWGTPARPLKQYLEQLAVLSRLAKKRGRQD